MSYRPEFQEPAIHGFRISLVSESLLSGSILWRAPWLPQELDTTPARVREQLLAGLQVSEVDVGRLLTLCSLRDSKLFESS